MRYFPFPTYVIGFGMFVRSTRNQPLEYLKNRLTQNRQILHGHPYRHRLQPHTQDMTSLSTSAKKLQRKKTVENTANGGFWWNFSRTVLARITKLYTLIDDSRPHKPAGYDFTDCFWSAAKCNQSAQNGSGQTKSPIIQQLFNLESPRLAGTSVPTQSKAIPDMTAPAASSQHLSKFEKRLQMSHPTALFALSLMQCQRRLQISRLKNISNVFELSGVAFRLALPYGFLFNKSDNIRRKVCLHNLTLHRIFRLYSK